MTPDTNTVECYTESLHMLDFVLGKGFWDWEKEKCEGTDRFERLIRRYQPDSVELKCAV